MAELTTTKLNAESHLLLDQPLLRLPYELARKNFKTAQRHIESSSTTLVSALKSTTSAAANDATPAATLAALDTMLQRAQTLKRKLEALHADETTIHRQQRARLAHLQQLHDIPSLADVKYDEWSRVRLDRLLVDYMLRMGYVESARLLAREKGIEELVDIEAFVACRRIEESLRQGRTGEALAWYADNKQALKKTDSNLEVELRLQQYIELVRTGDNPKLIEATLHARKYLAAQQDTEFTMRAAGLLVFPPGTAAEPYRVISTTADRWESLASLFLETHHTLLSIPSTPLLHIALSAGLSALKTPSCHSAFASSSSNASSSVTSVCPICSTELNELARNVPYAHHTKSHVENDPVVLPNGRVYGRDKLMAINEKLGTPAGKVRDPTDMSQLYDLTQVKKVFIS
ncbi:Protein FYV10 [Cryomyces minteri]|uniref:Protein FYV10 n=1 Tax=Cryomyces minteri TaxID=331657 RepID=A0A4U0Y4E3_9PEZI|nr:Protein FYV10 [Cryomyces minteri]